MELTQSNCNGMANAKTMIGGLANCRRGQQEGLSACSVQDACKSTHTHSVMPHEQNRRPLTEHQINCAKIRTKRAAGSLVISQFLKVFLLVKDSRGKAPQTVVVKIPARAHIHTRSIAMGISILDRALSQPGQRLYMSHKWTLILRFEAYLWSPFQPIQAPSHTKGLKVMSQ